MDLKAEKSLIIKQVDQINDEALILAIKNLLDFGLSHQSLEDKELEASINRGLSQLEMGDGRSHEEIWPELTKAPGK